MVTALLSSNDNANPVVKLWKVFANNLMSRRRKSRKYIDNQSSDSHLSVFRMDIIIVEYSPVKSLAFWLKRYLKKKKCFTFLLLMMSKLQKQDHSPQIYWYEFLTFPKLQQISSQPIRSSNIVQSFWSPFGQTLE